jgi:uncharacterized coiled-coil protein SlyX
MNDSSCWRRCAYEQCPREDLIEVQRGHRPKQFHNENCRQAQHRLLASRNVRDALRQVWLAWLPETQAFLEDTLAQYGEMWTRCAITAITAERDQAQQPSITEDERIALQQQWADMQPFTRNILDGLLTSRRDTVSFLNLITLAIGEERRHATCNSALEQRVAYLEITLAEYRQIVDLENREKIEQQFMVMGELLGHRAIPTYGIGLGIEKWQDYRSWTDERTLAEVIRDGKEILFEEEAAKERAREKGQLRQVERQLAQERARREGLERQCNTGDILTDEQRTSQLSRDLNAVRIGVASAELYQTLYGQALLVVQEREHEVEHLKTRISKQLERRIAKQQTRIQELEAQVKVSDPDLLQRVNALEAERTEWIAWKEAEIVGSGALTAMRQYLQAHEHASIPIRRNGVTMRIWTVGEDAVAFSHDHGLVRLNDDELEQGRIWVCKKMGTPVIVTKLPIGESAVEGQRRLQVERELDTAQAENLALHRELARYLPPPRSLLECSLRLWSTRTTLFHAGDDVEAFIKEASDQKLLKEIDWTQDCYFIGTHLRRRRKIIAEAIGRGEKLLYRGDPELVITSIDEQGYVTIASGGRTWLDSEAVEQFWALLVAEEGQRHVGSNIVVVHLQQYLHEHPGMPITIHQGKKECQLILVDDDALAVTTRHRPLRLYEDGLEQAHRWVEAQL